MLTFTITGVLGSTEALLDDRYQSRFRAAFRRDGMDYFTKEVWSKLGSYVYVYIDPRTHRPFYIGKGRGNRAFSHLKPDGNSDKAQKLRELAKLEIAPQIDILRYGLTEKESLHVEAAAIELLELDELVNEIHGHSAKHGPRDTAQEVQHRFSARTVVIKEKALLFNITKSFRPTHTPIQLYDVTRSAWVVNKGKADKAELAFAMYAGVIREVYKIINWLPAGTTMTAVDRSLAPDPERWEFVGNLAEEPIRKKYNGKRVKGLSFSQNPVRYANFHRQGIVEEYP
jgi:uncharacterized protein